MAFRVLSYSNNLKHTALITELLSRSFCSGPKNVGFIGLGNMGGPMASNLMAKGHKLHVFDVSANAKDAMKTKGAVTYDNVSDLAKVSDFVITMLPTNDIVADTYDTILAGGINTSTMFVDSSTIDPNVAKAVQKKIKAAGGTFVDAPVSGGVPGAQNATLTFMVGGTTEEYDRVKGLLEGMGKKITHCGSYGMGQAAKVCNNMMLGISMCGLAECMNLAIRLGLDAKVFADIINASTGRCWASEVNNPVPGLIPTAPAAKEYAGGFATGLITKDLGIASAVATSSNTPIPLGALTHQIYRTLMAKGLANKDFSVVYDFIKNNDKV
ncbi:probable 3-hydroxyisobutyrate dehydrogenase, mitochondrial [Topomyia yanbarensis]|uniref:probable 3-hydroxyisobutyrate dehydrogenase, mitochondrial n=1 Tax=Topomyia yanbarensis TaxID=2498891 RepID=UPI00273A9973|nr:probable 3-hydroxyisobutyrate dehydrogenase, mitochondrial [Topomyia yanbarensis]